MADRRAGWLAGLMMAAFLTGCASVPDSGPAVPVAMPGLSQSSEPEDSQVNAPLTRPSDDAQASASAYLNALPTTHNPGRLADVFLSSAIRAAFDQNPSMVVVSQANVTVGAIVGDTTTALFTGALTGTVDSEGRFVEAGARSWQVPVRMVRQAGVWLFADPPPLIVAENQFTDVFNAVTVYFAATASTITGADPQLLVPEQRYINVDAGSSTPTQVVDFVLAGPSEALSRVAHNPLPGIKRSSRVTVDEGDLVIELDPEAESASLESLNAFVAEVGWSLSAQFSGRIRLLVGGRPLDVPHFASSQPQSAWNSYNPTSVADPIPDYLVQGGGVRRAPGSPVGAVGPRLGSTAATRRVRTAAVSLDGTRLATVWDDPVGGQRLWIADASGTLQPTLKATSIGRPSWGGNSSTVVVPVAGRLWEVGVGNANRPIEIDVFAEGGRPILDVTSVRLSLDGVRALLIAGTGAVAKVYVGTLTGATNPDGALVLTVRQLKVDGSPRDVVWSGSVTAAVAVVSSRNSVSVEWAPVDGSPGRTRSSQQTAAEPIRVSADPTVPARTDVLIEIAGRIYPMASTSAIPSKGIAGQAPFYPG
jgi:hypothetical protein